MWRYFLEGSTELPVWRRQAWTAVSFNRALFTHESRLCVNPRLVTQRTAVEMCACVRARLNQRAQGHFGQLISAAFKAATEQIMGRVNSGGQQLTIYSPVTCVIFTCFYCDYRSRWPINARALNGRVSSHLQRKFKLPTRREYRAGDSCRKTPAGGERSFACGASTAKRDPHLHVGSVGQPQRARGVKEMLLADHDRHTGSNCTIIKSFQLLFSPL